MDIRESGISNENPVELLNKFDFNTAANTLPVQLLLWDNPIFFDRGVLVWDDLNQSHVLVLDDEQVVYFSRQGKRLTPIAENGKTPSDYQNIFNQHALEVLKEHFYNAGGLE